MIMQEAASQEELARLLFVLSQRNESKEKTLPVVLLALVFWTKLTLTPLWRLSLSK